DVEKFHSGGSKWRDKPSRVTGDVGHFGSGGFAAEALVERLRERDRAGDERRIHQLGLPTEWERVPGDEARVDGLLHLFAIVGRSLFQIFVEEPGPGGPGVVGAIGAFRAVELLGGFDRFGKKFAE